MQHDDEQRKGITSYSRIAPSLSLSGVELLMDKANRAYRTNSVQTNSPIPNKREIIITTFFIFANCLCFQ